MARQAVVLASIPLLVIAGVFLWFAAACEDDFCNGMRAEMAAYWVVGAVIVIWVTVLSARRGHAAAAAASTAWAWVAGLALLAFSASQVIERDWLPATITFVLGLCALGFAWWATRRPRPTNP